MIIQGHVAVSLTCGFGEKKWTAVGKENKRTEGERSKGFGGNSKKSQVGFYPNNVLNNLSKTKEKFCPLTLLFTLG